MHARIFYSWQSDIRAACCRTLIQDALDAASRTLVSDGHVEVLPVVDRDTQGLPGSPDIGKAIFEKIDDSDVLVADVTIVGKIDGARATPNPNVLIELGYALKALGDSRILLVQNAAFGAPEDLPFDLRQKRVLTYVSPEEATERAPARRQLATTLKTALATIVASRVRTVALANSGITRWVTLLAEAIYKQSSVEFESSLSIESESSIFGRGVTVPAELAGPVRVWGHTEYEFTLGFPLEDRTGVTTVVVPYSQVEDIWPGADARLHVMLKRGLVIASHGSRFD